MQKTNDRLASCHEAKGPVTLSRVAASLQMYPTAQLMMNDASMAQMYRLSELKTAKIESDIVPSAAQARQGVDAAVASTENCKVP